MDNKFIKDIRFLNSTNLIINFSGIILSNIFIGLFLGWLISQYTKWTPWYVIMLILGVISGFYQGFKELLKEVEKYDRIEKNAKKNDHNDTSNNDK